MQDDVIYWTLKKIKASPQQQDKFKVQCQVANIPDLKLVLDVRTRWNSTYDMLVRARKLKEVSLFILIFI